MSAIVDTEQTEAIAHSASPWSFIRPYRGRLVLAAFMLLMTAGLALTVPRLLGMTVQALKEDNPADSVPPLAIAMMIVAVVQAGTRISSRIILFNIARLAEYDLRSLLFRHLLTLDSDYYRKNATGDVMSRLTNDVQTVRAMWGPGFLNLINTSFLFTVALGLMISVDPVLTAWAIIPYPLMFGIGLVFGKHIYKTSRSVQEQLGFLSSEIQQDLTGVAIIKSYNLEANRYANFEKGSKLLIDRNMAMTRVRGKLAPILGAVAALGSVVVIYVGGTRVINNHLTLGQLIEFNAYLALLVWPTLAMGWMISLLQRGKASWERLQGIFQTKPDVADGDHPALEPSSVRGDVEFRGLQVAIGPHEIIHGIDLELKAGTTTAIVGRTGSGKSTLISALPRLNRIEEGQCFIDGVDINDLPLTNLRSLIGYAPQEAFLFSTTIGNNIRFGVDRSPTPPTTEEGYHEAIMAAARAAGLARDLDALPEGLETIVGERGITLSGGQRQRVALARALATQPKILVLDDSLSSVDAETEREILGELSELMKDRTSVLISHRVAAVRRADQIAVLEEGKLVELGSHDQLMAKAGVYKEIYLTQLEEDLVDG